MASQMIIAIRQQILERFSYSSRTSCTDSKCRHFMLPCACLLVGLLGASAAVGQLPFRDPRDDVLYFVLVDRFNDGDPTNNCGDYTGDCNDQDSEKNVLRHGYFPGNKGYYHGGDITGLSQRLDYIQELGATAVWVSPVFKNKTVQQDAGNLFKHAAGYHGYWVTDFENVDPHFGTNEDFGAMVSAAHSRDMKVFMDIICNHTADVIMYEGDRYSYRDTVNHPYMDDTGNVFDARHFAYAGLGNSFPALTKEAGFPYRTKTLPKEKHIKNPPWLNNPIFYHNRGSALFEGNSPFKEESFLYGDFYGLDDLFTERKEVVDGMIDIYAHWIRTYKVDGFRIDTVKHVNMEFWRAFCPAISSIARNGCIFHFFAFGEVSDWKTQECTYKHGPQFLSQFSAQGKLQATLDFNFQIEAREFASRSAPTNRLKNFFEMDDYYRTAEHNAHFLPTFVGNHDRGRIGFFVRQDNPGAGGEELLKRCRLAHALMFFSRGIPVIYYGDEQGFTGHGDDKAARQDMFANKLTDFRNDSLIGTTRRPEEDHFDATHPLYQAIKEYAQIRRNHKALRRGAQIHRHSEDQSGVYAFSRLIPDEKKEYVVAFNNAFDKTVQADIPTFHEQGTRFSAVYPPDTRILIVNEYGKLPVSVPPLDFVIYAAADTIPENESKPHISLSIPSHDNNILLSKGTEVGFELVDRIPIDAVVTEPIFAEVRFYVRIKDTEFMFLGNDLEPPYRLYFDPTTVPENTPLTFRVTVNDLWGHLESAEVSGIQVKKKYCW